MSFQVIYKENRAAAELLLLLGFYHHSDIPLELFKIGQSSIRLLLKDDGIDLSQEPYIWIQGLSLEDKDAGWDRVHLDNALGLLESYALLHVGNDDSLSVHPLVHTWAEGCGNQATGQHARAHLALAMISKVHSYGLPLYAGRRNSLRRRYYNHVLNCVRHSRKGTTLLEASRTSILAGTSLLSLDYLLETTFLTLEEKGERLNTKLKTLTLVNSCQRDSLDNITTLQALRNVLLDLWVPYQLSHNILDRLIDIPIELLPIAAASNPSVNEAQHRLALLIIYTHHLGALGKHAECGEAVQEALEYAGQHKQELSTHDYLYTTQIWGALTYLRPENVLDTVDDHFVQVQKDLGVHHPVTVQMRVFRARILYNCGKMSEATIAFIRK